MFVALVVATSGCGGINGSQSVSPLDFFLPGIIKNSPPVNNPVPLAGLDASNVVASVR
jgi:hypothetical protein